MDEEFKCVMMLDEDLPIGVAANVAAILGVIFGKKMPEIVGHDVEDADMSLHLGIVECPIPVLKTDAASLKTVRANLLENGDELMVIDFSDIAQRSKTYEEYEREMADSDSDSIGYLGVLVVGSKKLVNRYTGSLPLMR